MRTLLSLFTLVVLLTAEPIWANRIIVDEGDLDSIIGIQLDEPISRADARSTFTRSIDVSERCSAESRVLQISTSGGAPSEQVTHVDVRISATCLWAAFLLYEEFRKDPRFKIELMIPKPGMTGSN